MAAIALQTKSKLHVSDTFEEGEHPVLALTRGGRRIIRIPSSIALEGDGSIAVDCSPVKIRTFSLWESMLSSDFDIAEEFLDNLSKRLGRA
mgnify:FL=1